MKRRIKLGVPKDADCPSLYLCFGASTPRLRSAFVAVMELLCERTEGFEHDNKRKLIECGYMLPTALFDPDAAAKLRELWEAIDESTETAFAYGKDQGSSLLKSLAAGETTIAEFNEATLNGSE